MRRWHLTRKDRREHHRKMHRFIVSDMVCEGCVRSLTKAVQGVAPGSFLHADLEQKRVDVDSPASAEQIRDAMIAAGFTVSPVV